MKNVCNNMFIANKTKSPTPKWRGTFFIYV